MSGEHGTRRASTFARLFRKQVREALRLIISAAEAAVEAGLYPNVRIALAEMAANQRKAARLGVDLHKLLKDYER